MNETSFHSQSLKIFDVVSESWEIPDFLLVELQTDFDE